MPRISQSQRQLLWQQRLQRYRQSSLTVAKFCQQEKISVPSFYHWKRRLETQSPGSSQQEPAKHQTTDANRFAQLHVRPAHQAAPIAQATEVMLPGGITISLGTHSETVALIVDRLVKHSISDSNANPNRAESC